MARGVGIQAEEADVIERPQVHCGNSLPQRRQALLLPCIARRNTASRWRTESLGQPSSRGKRIAVLRQTEIPRPRAEVERLDFEPIQAARLLVLPIRPAD